MKLRPRDYQIEMMNGVRACFRKDGVIVVVLVSPTGSGKTVTFCCICDGAVKKGRRVTIIVHRKELLKQASKALTRMEISHGLIAPWATPKPREMVQVASIDALSSKKGKLLLESGMLKADLLIFDEGHHVLEDNKWGVAWSLMGKPRALLVTATPSRPDGKGLGKNWGGIADEMVIGPSVPDLIDRGSLIRPRVYGITEEWQPDTKGIRKDKDGDLNAAQLAHRVDKPHLIGNAVKEYTGVCPGARAVAFCVNVKHAINVRDAFNAAGYKFELLVGDKDLVSEADRTRIVAQLDAGEIDGICTVDLVSEGFDCPGLSCCLMLRPTESEIVFLQQVGRIMRPEDGKTECWLLDHAGNVGRWVNGEFKRKHGMPDEEREWSLEGIKKRKRGSRDVTETIEEMCQCKKCRTIFVPAPVCPSCGEPVPVKASAGRSDIEQRDGKLNEITPEMAKQMQRERRAAQGMAGTVEEMVNTLGYSLDRAEKVVAARAEKKALVDGLIDDLTEWRESTGQTVLDAFGVPIAAIRNMKPRELRDLRKRVDDTLAVWRAVAAPAPQEELIF